MIVELLVYLIIGFAVFFGAIILGAAYNVFVKGY